MEKRIKAIIDEYKAKRVSEADYFKKMNELKECYRKGYSITRYPEKIKDNNLMTLEGGLLPKK